jgi:hypothetical protein
MANNVIAMEDRQGPFQEEFHRIIRMVPDRDRHDKNLQRLLAFRLKLDGESVLRQFLTDKIRDVIKCAYTGSLYDFLKDDLQAKKCNTGEAPPGAA